MMTPVEMRSLDRFVTARGAALAGVTSDTQRLRVMGVLASVYSIAGVAEAGVGMALALSGTPMTTLLLQGATLLLTGGLLAGIRGGIKHRLQQEPSLPVEVTPEAKTLLQTLLAHLYGWPLSRIRRRRRYRRLMRQKVVALPKEARCEDILHPQTFALLESAARQANRIYGLLEQGKAMPSSSLQQMAGAIAAATDEAMATLFQIAAQMEKFPENSASRQEVAQNQIAELQALAAQMEQLCADAATASPSRLHTIRQALQADIQAREELKATVSAPTIYATSALQPEEEVQTVTAHHA